MDEHPNFTVTTSITGDARDPFVVAAALNALAAQLKVTVSVSHVLTTVMASMLTALDQLNTPMGERFTDDARQVLRDHVRELRREIGEHPLVTILEQLSGREPLKLVVTNPIDPAA